MSDLSREAQDLLATVRAHDEPTQGREAEILAGLSARLTTGAPDLDPSLLGTQSSLFGAGATKIGLVLLLGTVVAVPVLWASSVPETPQATAVADAPASVVAPASEPEPVPAPELKPRVLAESPPVPALVPAPPPTPARSAATPRRPAAPPAPTNPQAELQLIRSARAALAQGDAARALALLARHAKSFPNGVLVQERLVSHAQARCLAGDRAAARREVRAFIERFPSSVLRERAQGICTDE